MNPYDPQALEVLALVGIVLALLIGGGFTYLLTHGGLNAPEYRYYVGDGFYLICHPNSARDVWGCMIRDPQDHLIERYTLPVSFRGGEEMERLAMTDAQRRLIGNGLIKPAQPLELVGKET